MSKNYALAFSKPDANPIAIGVGTNVPQSVVL